MKKLNLKGVTADTIARGLFLIVSLINGLCGLVGWTKLDIDENTIYTAVSGIAILISAVYGFYKNNDFTKGAQISSDFMKSLKNGDITEYDLEEL